MPERWLFRLALRASGILLLGMQVPFIVSIVGWVLFGSVTLLPDRFGADFFLGLLPHVFPIGLGLYLLLGGGWLMGRCLPAPGTCPECGYDLSASSGDRCPECGAAR